MYPNLDEFAISRNVDGGFDVLCFPSEGSHFEMTYEEFIKAYPYHKEELLKQIEEEL